MRVRFQADADLDGRILRGLRRTAPEIDMRTAADAELAALEDPEIFEGRCRRRTGSSEPGPPYDTAPFHPLLSERPKSWSYPASRGESYLARNRRACSYLERQ